MLKNDQRCFSITHLAEKQLHASAGVDITFIGRNRGLLR
jgi:hypothetical protein